MSNKSSLYIPEVFWEGFTASTRSRLVALWVDADSYSRKLCSYSLAIRLPFALPPRNVSWLLYFSTSPRTTASWQSKKICTCSWAFFPPSSSCVVAPLLSLLFSFLLFLPAGVMTSGASLLPVPARGIHGCRADFPRGYRSACCLLSSSPSLLAATK